MAAAPKRHVLQSWEWGQFKADYGWTPIRLLFSRGEAPVGAASVLSRQAGPFSICYVPKGPAVDFSDSELATFALRKIADVARRRRAIYVKIDPDIPREDGNASAAVEAAGFGQAGHIQLKDTALLDISGSEEDIQARMKSKTRYNLRLAQKKGVELAEGTPADFPEAYRVYQETGERDRFIIRPYDYCRDQWQLFLGAGLSAFYIARYEGATLGIIMPYRLGKRMWYMFGASSNLHRNLMPNYLLQWRAIQWGREHGCTEYDMWGIPEVLEEGQPLWGVYLFKQGFGAVETHWAGAFDCVLQPALYAAWTRAVPAGMSLLRRVRHEVVDERQLVGV
ncbi:MAG: peptidoglycan bridge formation glycyltransferase FemA/FemB family protein [Chloroflexi bacterium]|nr:peptidoglycan bridge formation glycyltransferase FemA/FemB family protein [Chloroflexota bacterium]